MYNNFITLSVVEKLGGIYLRGFFDLLSHQFIAGTYFQVYKIGLFALIFPDEINNPGGNFEYFLTFLCLGPSLFIIQEYFLNFCKFIIQFANDMKTRLNDEFC